jgi:hypothetical protein
MSRIAVSQVHEALMGLDFRNGPLRRKYDSVKYAVKAIEAASFEISLSGSKTDAQLLFTDLVSRVEGQNGEQVDKRARIATDGTDELTAAAQMQRSYLDKIEIAQIQERMDRFDQCREQVIKDCRDVQKLSKQAIFAIQRGNLSEAEKKLDTAKQGAQNILELIYGVSYHPYRLGW